MEVRQIQIENDEIGRAERCNLQSVGGVLGFEHRVALKFEAGAKKSPDLRLVVDQERDVAGLIHLSRPPVRKVASEERRAGRWKPLLPVRDPCSRCRWFRRLR